MDGWSLLDRNKRNVSLTGIIEPGHTLLISLSGRDLQLSNQGGIITLLNSQGLKVDGVSYTKEDVKQQGYTLVF